MFDLNRLPRFINRLLLSIDIAVLTAWLTPFSLRVDPRFYLVSIIIALFSCVVICVRLSSPSSSEEASSKIISKFRNSIIFSSISLSFSLIVIFIFIPIYRDPFILFNPGNLFASRLHSYDEISINSPSKTSSVRLVCTDDWIDGPSHGFIYLDQFIFQKRIAYLQLFSGGKECPTVQEQGFQWSPDEHYLRWKSRKKPLDNPIRLDEVKVY
jgi:hypothetical protein